ncbi:MAG: tRNA (adenosine(37)-N6)-threonylcarbamoyltransferase complex transferase subunit TsaD, partial [Myxococcales bacterium]|nr:tRNA (adenosine(37)-N6)-threonylcarbamoyltransferase complex transferase subunit TsaD [Myxococcales bacterium]
MRVLGIETSCDDTSVALYDSERGVAANLVSSQVDLHDHFGGVVPELASRAHLVNLLPLVDVLLARERLRLGDLDGIAVTAGPGLIGALLVGLSTGKALAMAHDLPLVGVHHIEGHILANALTEDMVLPAVVL